MPTYLDSYPGIDAPAGNAAAVTLHDSNTLTPPSRALYVGGAGNLKVTLAGGTTVTFSSVPAGTVLPVRASVCWSTGSTASNVVSLY